MKVVWEYLLRRMNESVKSKSLEEIVEVVETISEVCEWVKEEHVNSVQMAMVTAAQTLNRIRDQREKGGKREEEGEEDDDDGEEDVDEVDSSVT